MREIGSNIRICSLRERRQETTDFFSKNISKRGSQVLMRKLEEEIAEFHFRRHMRLPVLEFFDVEIRPFWRDNKPTPPLPFEYPPHPLRSHHY